MGNKYHIEATADTTEYNSHFTVNYTTPGLGFMVRDHKVTQDTAHLIQIAIEFGKQEARAEIRKTLGL
jgi:hypothetical protein